MSNNGCFNNNSNNMNNNKNDNNNTCTKEELPPSLKLEFGTKIIQNRKNEKDEENVVIEEKESSNDLHLSYCRGLSTTPLAVPMVADTLQNSVTRNDAKAITDRRLKRLKELSRRSEEQLSTDQKDEKKRIIRLEKNRRAAAMSRRKKKIYVKGLEEKYNLMSRHLAILEMENSHLRAVLNASHHGPHAANIANITNIPHMKLPNLSHFQIPHLMSNSSSANTTTTATHSSTAMNSMEPAANGQGRGGFDSPEPPLKRRKLNDGICVTSGTPSSECDNSSDISTLEPLPISQNNAVLPPPPPSYGRVLPHFNIQSRYVLPPNIRNIHPSRLVPYAHHMAPPFNMAPNRMNGKINIMEIPTERKSIESEEERNEDNDMPPAIVVPRLSNEYLPMMEDDVIDERVDESGYVMAFQQEIKKSDVYL